MIGSGWDRWEEWAAGKASGDAMTGLRNCLAKISLDPNHGPLGAGESGSRGKVRVKDKADRATMESVLDPRTRIILFKLLQRGTSFEAPTF